MNRIKSTLTFAALLVALSLNAVDSSAQTASMSLDEAINHARNNSVEMMNAKLEVEASRQEVKSIVASGLPQINASGTFTHNVQIAAMSFPDFLSPAVYGVLIKEGLLSEDRFQVGEPQTVAFGAPSVLTGMVTMDQLIFDGTFFLGLNAAKEYVNMTELISEQKEIDMVESVTKAYYLAVLTDEVYTKLSDNLRTTQEVRDQTKAMLDAGLAEQLDVDRLDYALTNIKSRIRTAEMQSILSMQMLKLLIGMDINTQLELSTSITDLSNILTTPSDTTLESGNRIEMKIMEEQLVLDSLQIKRYKVGYLPKLTFSANHQQNSFATEAEFVDLGKTWNPGTMYSFKLSIPIFDGLYKQSKIEQAKIRKMQDENMMQNLENSLQLEVQQAIMNYNVQLNNLETQDLNRKLARSIYEKTRIKFNEGMGSSFEMIQAESDLYQAEIEYTNSLYNLLVAQIELQKALGKL